MKFLSLLAKFSKNLLVLYRIKWKFTILQENLQYYKKIYNITRKFTILQDTILQDTILQENVQYYKKIYNTTRKFTILQENLQCYKNFYES
jgi:hypothetical protein